MPASIDIQLTVSKWTPNISITGNSFEYNRQAQGPVIEVKNSGPLTYLYQSTDGKNYNSNLPPVNTGTYSVTVSSSETGTNYPATLTYNFNILKKKAMSSVVEKLANLGINYSYPRYT